MILLLFEWIVSYIFFAVDELSPDIFSSKLTLAVFISIGISLTQSLTMSLSDWINDFEDISCWYWPIPILSGGIYSIKYVNYIL